MKKNFLFLFPVIFIFLSQACKKGEESYSVPMTVMGTDIKKMNKEKPDTLEVNSTSKEVCVTEKITTTPGCADCLLLDPTSDVFFLGNVLSAQSLQDGKYIQIGTEKDRKPITVSASIPNFANTTSKIDSVSLSKVRNGIKNMVMSEILGVPPAKMSINTTQIFDQTHLNLVVLGNFSTSMTKVSAGFNFEDTNVQSRYLIDIVQIFYSVDLDQPGPEGFFSKKPTNIENNSPVYISSVKYGRRILIAVETKKQLKKSDVELKADYNGVVTKASAQGSIINDKFLSENSVKVMINGGNPNNGYEIFKAVSKADQVFDLLGKDAICSKDNPGQELAFSFRNASNGSMYYVSQSGQYVARKCETKTENDTTIIIPTGFIQHKCARHVAGKDRNFGGNPNVQFNLNLSFEGNTVYADISALFEENGGDGTAGRIDLYRYPICSISEDKDIIEIKSKTSTTVPKQTLQNQGATSFPFDQSISPVSAVSLIGDSSNNNNDDLFPGPCDNENHCQIRQIDFYPIKITFTKKVPNRALAQK